MLSAIHEDEPEITEAIEDVVIQQIANELGERYPGTLRAFQKYAQGRVYTTLWACKRAFKKYHGVYPEDLLKRIYAWLEVPQEWKICHLFAGIVEPIYPNELRVDLNPAVHPDLLEDATHTSIRDMTMDLTLADPPYDKKNLEIYNGYTGLKLPWVGPKAVLLEARRITKVGGYYGSVGWKVNINYGKPLSGDKRVAVVAITEGANMGGRFLNVFQRMG